jgi:hypothetical protein
MLAALWCRPCLRACPRSCPSPPCAVRPLRFFAGRPDLAEATVVDVLRNDPRSVYRKAREQPDYLLCLDGIDVSCVWDNDAVRVIGARMAPTAALRPRDRREAPGATSRGGDVPLRENTLL